MFLYFYGVLGNKQSNETMGVVLCGSGRARKNGCEVAKINVTALPIILKRSSLNETMWMNV